MRFSILAAAAALPISPIFVFAAPAQQYEIAPTDWTYRDIYDYAVASDGMEVAELLEEHIMETSRDWDDIYDHDIQLSGGATLTLTDHPSGQHFLASLGEPIRRSYVQAFPFSNRCSGPISFTWKPITLGGCYTYVDKHRNIRMYSAKIATAGIDFGMWRESVNCHAKPGDALMLVRRPGDGVCTSPTDGRGFNSFQIKQF